MTPARAFFLGAQGRNRTAHTGIFSPLLYQLSYLGEKRLQPLWKGRFIEENRRGVQPSNSGLKR